MGVCDSIHHKKSKCQSRCYFKSGSHAKNKILKRGTHLPPLIEYVCQEKVKSHPVIFTVQPVFSSNQCFARGLCPPRRRTMPEAHRQGEGPRRPSDGIDRLGLMQWGGFDENGPRAGLILCPENSPSKFTMLYLDKHLGYVSRNRRTYDFVLFENYYGFRN